MNYKKLLKIGDNLLSVFIVLYIVQNTYFGWNKLPMSELEEQTDYILKGMYYIGLFLFAMPLFKLYRNAVNKIEDE